ncbi:MAG: TonB-dependent receptor [Acidobacteria bacterium]|nr:TonB-dependent receptor [Acidobacteriota bacterium]
MLYGGRLYFLLSLILSLLPGARADVAILGRVVDENGVAVAGARVAIAGFPPVRSDPTGRFTWNTPSPGEYLVSADQEGFFALKNQRIRVGEGENELTLVLNHQREFVEQVDVVYSPPAIDPEQPAAQQKLTGIEILEVPFAAAHDLRNALPMFQGVIQDTRGDIHVQGGAADQTYWTLDGFNITDPVNGRFDARLSIDAVRSLDLQTTRFAAETGKGSAGSVDLKTGMGDDRFRFSATNFVPGLEHHKNFVLTKWTPRATVSGPIRRGRTWFSNGFDTYYDLNVIDELPRGQDRTSSWRVGDVIRGQVNLQPGNILTGSFLLNYLTAPRNGLDYFSPLETTVDHRQRFYLYSVKDQVYFGSGGLLEFGFALSRGFRREIPQGQQTYIFSPEGRSGNYFVDSKLSSGREQWLANIYLPAFEGAGRHEIKGGTDVTRSGFTQFVDRHDYEVRREDMSLARLVSFAGPNEFSRRNFETALYLQDHWTPREGVSVEAGLRADWDQLVRDPLVSPRFAIALAPRWLGATKLSAGIGIFRDALNLRTLSQHLDQRSISYFYGRDGSPTAGPLETYFLVDDRRLRAPAYRNLSLGAERPLGGGFYGRVNFVNKHGRRGFTFLPMAPSNGHNRFGLFNARNDRYHAIDFTVRRTFHRQYEFLAGYTRSSARSDAVLDFSLEDPLFAQQAGGPLRWDAPHRFQTWGWAPLPAPPGWPALFRNFSVAYWLETRSGFPFRVVNEEAQLVGPPNSRRLPAFFSLNLHLERRFTLLHQQWAWRAGFNNITNHKNPNVVNNNIDSPGFLTYAGGQHRALTVRLRFLGKT